MLTTSFLKEFRRITESNWGLQTLSPDVYGFQFQRGTRWNPGISSGELTEYQRTVGFEFPTDCKKFLTEMNGTDLPTINVYGSCGEPSRTSVGVYSFPRDVELIMQRIEDVNRNRAGITADLAEQGFDLPRGAHLLPLFGHRYVVCGSDPDTSTVLSVVVHEVDAIVYADSLQKYLMREFLGETPSLSM